MKPVFGKLNGAFRGWEERSAAKLMRSSHYFFLSRSLRSSELLPAIRARRHEYKHGFFIVKFNDYFQDSTNCA